MMLALWIFLVLGVGLARGRGGGGGTKWLCSQTTFCTTESEMVDGENYKKERFESQRDCRLSCGKYGSVWPMPTGETSLSHNRVHFDPQKIHFDVRAPSEATSQFLDETRRLFLGNLRKECRCDCTLASSAKILVKANVISESLVLDWRTHENYKLFINTTKAAGTVVNIQATTVYGARHAFETLSNLVTGSVASGLLLVRDVVISDRPVYAHRGLMLDTSRNFIPLSYVRKTINGMAASKMNVLHWHVVDAHSFPLDITRVPQMRIYGAYSSSQTYSPKEVVQLMKYARLRGIRILIEIDGPAHAHSGWQWGPEEGLGQLSVCLNRIRWEAYCAAPPCGQLNPMNENMYTVLKAIFRQVAEMGAPEETIHMGGDEVYLSCWNTTKQIRDKMLDDGYDLSEKSFFRLWAQFHQRNLLAWEEINRRIYPSIPEPKPVILWSSRLTDPLAIENYLPKNRFIIQTWVDSHEPLNKMLLQRGYRIIVSTKDAWYLDHGFYGSTVYHTWRTVYNNKLPKSRDRRQVLGGEVCMWSESVDQNSLESRIWPRAGAAAERLWSNPKDAPELIERRFYRYRDRLVDRGIHADAVTPRYCVLHEGMCEHYFYNTNK
ncbi:chitooligosaccharidolytic beta-N-acetylglucosaminidase-like [Drosophila pseudoobscura]|uniref:beta-N-acetylhexosaminidase n=1 Tax=Drosophila pseudoobscura pseudoobscura TaxID=46245 RepID=A0A6I8UZP7_DROPS|nr:chitooligosaccharidolytic beta-N-acetylglucosaminidase [Drosophila pseudoobscura]